MLAHSVVLSLLLALPAPRARPEPPPAVERPAATGDEEVLEPPGTGEGDPERPRLSVGAPSAAVLAGGAIALWGDGGVHDPSAAPPRCHWCEPGGFDLWARDRLEWREGDVAARASDLLLLGIPLCSAAALGWLGVREGGSREAIEDVLVIGAAVALADPLTTRVKEASARLRPGAWAAGGPRAMGDVHSFVSAHTARVFAAATAATQVGRLRGRHGWRWVAAVAFGAAAATGWLRMAADQHWATDVLAGAVAGASVGWAVPSLALCRPGERSRAATLVPAPGGLAVVF